MFPVLNAQANSALIMFSNFKKVDKRFFSWGVIFLPSFWRDRFVDTFLRLRRFHRRVNDVFVVRHVVVVCPHLAIGVLVSFIKTLFLSLMSKTNRLVFKPCIPLYPCLKFAYKGKWQGQKRVGVHKLRFFKISTSVSCKAHPKKLRALLKECSFTRLSTRLIWEPI